MRVIKLLFVILFSLSFAFSTVFAAHGGGKEKPATEAGSEGGDTSEGSPATQEGGGIRLGGDFGKGTEPMLFDDQSLIATPVPTVTPIIKLTNPEKNAWEDIRNTKDLIMRCNTDLPRYEKFMRKEFMSNLNEMQKAITTIHTYALLHKRDEVEYVWGRAASKGGQTLSICEEYVSEFNENLDSMKKKQSRVDSILKKHAKGIQQPDQIRKEWKSNKKQMFFTKKKIEYFESLFEGYASKYNKTIRDKEALVEKLLTEHQELHKP
jgi:hypothetical protein